MKAKLKLPRITMNMEEGNVTEWLVAIGDSFKEGEALYSIETDKAVTEVEAPCTGVLLEILVPAGEDAEPGTDVCVVEVQQ